MRIAVIGGTGLIGTRLVARLAAEGHDVVVASRATGVNSYTGEGLDEALAGAETLVDVSNSDYLDEAAANEFFYGSTLNLLTYGAAAGVRHHVALSVVGTDRLARTEGGYFAAKAAQERLIRQSGRAYSIVHATQFFEFIANIADAGTNRNVVRLSRAVFQPMAADDVAAAVAATATGVPVNRVVEFAGPEQFRLEELVRRHLRERSDLRDVRVDPLARYFGTDLDEDELLPGPDATIAPTRYADWLAAGGRPNVELEERRA
ncbi:SDR family oxidoreductase [Agromyces salentinus]|uniref:SDR family oxidoreductase n=1 Tax=Agromyces salentinus TaxID=269421 RepID=A0ABN2MFI0_9MICO|nr:NAD-dependent epimerase/dehydratase family protein [Agromyces salentinus]